MTAVGSLLRDRPVLVTGGSGFIGGHLVRRLLDAGAYVSIVDLVPTPLETASGDWTSRLHFDLVDLRSQSQVDAFFAYRKFDFVFHLAAMPLVGEAYGDPRAALETNILGTLNVLEALRTSSRPELVVVASSDKVYGQATGTAEERSPFNVSHPYDASKASADLITRAYWSSYGLPVTVTRFGNVYGEGDLHLSRIVPGICRAVLTGESLQIRSDGSYVRDYLYVADVVDGYLLLLDQRDRILGEAFNFSSSESYSVLELLRISEHVLGHRVPHEIKNEARNEIPFQHLDDSKIRSLGWKNTHSFAATLPQVLAWYRANLRLPSQTC